MSAYDTSRRPEDLTESERDKLERNWTELLQELRVIQTGTQILTGFLLTLPFQAKFQTLGSAQVTLYLCLVVGAALATALALAPVSVHRALFRHRAKAQIVNTGNRLAIATLTVVSLVLTGTMVFVFDMVAGDVAAIVAGIAALVVLAALWVALPLAVRPR
ncbi:sodium:proton antiporter [Subtercola vilae]|uniref:Sodium:proton antiporter n=1 Tax=Subtercola vilae TaxID=2056433 RepID=A0A4T2CB70_9MICO|nr:sodium:proton antiporter [Subtercola vilae]